MQCVLPSTLVLRSGPLSSLGGRTLPCTWYYPPLSRGLILSFRSLRKPDDERIVDDSDVTCRSLCNSCDWILRSPFPFVPSIGSPHNNLRITRILKFLSELGYEHLNYGFLLHVLNEQSEHDQLNTSLIRSSMDRWWANCLRGDREREWINLKIASVRDRDFDEPFIFTREMYQEAINNRTNEGRF